MKLEGLHQTKTVFSLEVFPPKREASVETIYHTLADLQGLDPDFISVTYGAGGSENQAKTLEIASAIKQTYGVESEAHLPGLYLSRSEVLGVLDALKAAGIDNILALRGDRNPDVPPKTDFRYASDLVSFIKEHGDFTVIGACYPEGHTECGNLEEDIRHLKTKVEAGTDILISQLFFDNEEFYAFRERASEARIHVPIEAGIMPVVNKKQIERMVSLCGARLPRKFTAMMARYEHKPEAMRDAGIAYAVDQIVDLMAQGVDGIHLYTMNNAYIARKIHEAVSALLAV